jgi:hexosaminidase
MKTSLESRVCPFLSFDTEIKEMMFSVLFLSSLIVTSATVPLWPLPSEFTFGSTQIAAVLDGSFHFSYSGHNEIMINGISRYSALIAPPSTAVGSIKTCFIYLTEEQTPVSIIGTDESYGVSISTTGSCKLASSTVWGALHALETFTQLLIRESDGLKVPAVPINIADTPRYGHRGLMIDTARHFQSVDEIKRIIETLPISKFNVLHWHLVDAESFPFNVCFLLCFTCLLAFFFFPLPFLPSFLVLPRFPFPVIFLPFYLSFLHL